MTAIKWQELPFYSDHWEQWQVYARNFPTDPQFAGDSGGTQKGVDFRDSWVRRCQIHTTGDNDVVGPVATAANRVDINHNVM